MKFGGADHTNQKQSWFKSPAHPPMIGVSNSSKFIPESLKVDTMESAGLITGFTGLKEIDPGAQMSN